MSTNTISEHSIEFVWKALITYPSGDYLPSARELSRTIHQSYSLIGAAYRELRDRGYVVKRGNCFVKVREGIFVHKHTPNRNPLEIPLESLQPFQQIG